jgi:DNA-binding Lrp family transcriptional regulator
MLLGVELGREEEVAGKLRSLEGVSEAFTVYGEHDVVAIISLESRAKLNHLVATVRHSPGVIRTSTLIAM